MYICRSKFDFEPVKGRVNEGKGNRKDKRSQGYPSPLPTLPSQRERRGGVGWTGGVKGGGEAEGLQLSGSSGTYEDSSSKEIVKSKGTSFGKGNHTTSEV